MAAKKSLIEPKETKAKPRKRAVASASRRKSPAKVIQAITKAATDVAPDLTDEDIALAAYLLWERRGRPMGSSEEDWYRAKEELTGSGTSSAASA